MSLTSGFKAFIVPVRTILCLGKMTLSTAEKVAVCSTRHIVLCLRTCIFFLYKHGTMKTFMHGWQHYMLTFDVVFGLSPTCRRNVNR